MILKTIKVSKKYGLRNCLYFIILFFISCLLSELTYFFLELNQNGYFLITLYLYLISCLSAVYVLVGTRLIFIMKHSKKSHMAKQLYPANIIDLITFNDSDGGTEMYGSNIYSSKSAHSNNPLYSSTPSKYSNSNYNSMDSFSNFTTNSNYGNFSSHSNPINYNNSRYDLVNNNISMSAPIIRNTINGTYSNSQFPSVHSNYTKYEEDKITNNPNNYFFNLALEKIGNEK